MRGKVGCFSLLFAFTLGALTCFGVYGFLDRFDTYYLSRHEAFVDALADTRAHCREAAHVHPVDCNRFSLTQEEETPSGWFFRFTSVDGRRTDSMWIGRRGEYDSTGQTNMDDPNALPTQTFINGKPVGSPH